MKTSMFLSSLLLAQGLLSGSQTQAQVDRCDISMALVPGAIEVRCGLSVEFGAAILVSHSDQTIPATAAMPELLLTEHLFASGIGQGGLYSAAVSVPWAKIALGEIYCQAVVADAYNQLHSSKVFLLADLLPILNPEPKPKPGYVGPPLTLSLISTDGIPPFFSLEVVFETPSNDYRLQHHSTRTSETSTDVYYILETPGEGQGLCDVVEFHRHVADLGTSPGTWARVFVALVKRGVNDDPDYRFELAKKVEIRS